MSRGILYMLLASLFFAGMNLLAKYLSGFHPMQVVFFRCFGTFVLIFPFMLYKRIPVLGKNKKFLIYRAIAGVISLACFFAAIQRIPVGSAVTIRYLSPIFAAIFAYYFLKERINAWQAWSFALAFGGVLFLKGVDLRIDTLSFMMLLISAFFVGIVFTLLRYIGQTENFLVIINYFMMVSILVSLFFLPYWRMPEAHELIPLGVIGLLGLIGQIFMTKAFALEESSAVVPFKYMEVVFVLIFGFFFLGEGYTIKAIIAIAIIILAMLMNVYGKSRKRKEKSSVT